MMFARRLSRHDNTLKLQVRVAAEWGRRLSFSSFSSSIHDYGRRVIPNQKRTKAYQNQFSSSSSSNLSFRSQVSPPIPGKEESFSEPWSVEKAVESLRAVSANSEMEENDPELGRKLRIQATRALFLSLVEEAGISKSKFQRSFTTSSQKPDVNQTNEKDKGSNDRNEGLLNPDLDTIKLDGIKTNSNKEDSISNFKIPDSASQNVDSNGFNTEAYHSIRSKQITALGKARAKTVANVRRALYGNVLICFAKLAAWLTSGSSSMLSELVHSIVDCGNQSLLLVGLRDAENKADRKHPYGYGKSVYFWALVSALGTFFLGAGVSMTHAVGELIDPSLQDITKEVWGVLGISLLVDGYVFSKTIAEIRETKPKGMSLWQHTTQLRDPATLAILLEDGAACLGIIMALAGISASHVTGMPIFDGLAGVGISALLASMGLILVRVNHRFLLGQAVDRDITENIEKILLSQRSIDNVQSVQSQWTSSETFSYKAEVDFDGTFLAAKLMPRYQREFLQVKDTLDQDLRVLLSWYAEDVIRTVEREVRICEYEIRRKYPGAEYIELEPMSKDADRFAIDDSMETRLRKIELASLNQYLRSLYQTKAPENSANNGEEDETDKKK
jgi:solute carrier family 30 (zinc transporter), member 9